ncbi:hypothetical protein ACFX5K_02210 [Rickettsiales bacterium LUAb2]
MHNKDVFYFDAITAININNGVVKLIMGNQDLDQSVESQGKNNPVPSRTVALPLNTFVYALAVFLKDPKNQDMITKMQEAAGLNKEGDA